ncbi:MAG: hypothetical protein M0C28_25600 [Candidatus Moduliflexus flocculans]|nr:hypothetical protein [Candidatus Moduliflexus flocculans]
MSRGYVDLTLDVMRAFGVRAERSADYSEFRVPGGQVYGSDEVPDRGGLERGGLPPGRRGPGGTGRLRWR